MKYRTNGLVFWLATFGILRDVIGIEKNRAFDQSYSLASILNPLEMVKTARRLVNNGVQKYRESLQEGDKMGAILKEDDDEGVTQEKTKERESSFFQQSRDDIEIPRDGMLGGIFRFMGVDSNSIGMVVLNVLIFVAEMVTKSMLGKNGSSDVDTRMIKENVMEWFLKGRNEKVDQIIHDARDRALPDSLITMLQNKTGNDTSCVQLLICKMSPFIWSIQKTVDEQLKPNENGTGPFDARSLINFNLWDKLFQIFPDKSRFISFGDDCEKRLPNCKLLNLAKFVAKIQNRTFKETA